MSRLHYSSTYGNGRSGALISCRLIWADENCRALRRLGLPLEVMEAEFNELVRNVQRELENSTERVLGHVADLARAAHE